MRQPRFIGRRRELDLLERRLTEAGRNRGGMVLLGGEPGVGKTRTVEIFAERAASHGATALYGRAYEGESPTAYGPFIEALNAFLARAGASPVSSLPAASMAPLAPLLPALRVHLAHLGEPAALKPEEERLRLLQAAARTFLAIADHAPLVLVLDDLHWADDGTLSMLRHVARAATHGRMLVLATYRDAEIDLRPSLVETLVALRRETTLERLQLRGLESGEIRELIETAAGHAAPPAFVAAVERATEGNPFFIHELLLHLSEEGRLRGAGGQLTVGATDVPQAVRQAVARRILRLSQECRQLLGAAATFERAFPFAAAARIAGLSEERGLAVLEEALAAQMIRPTETSERYDFRHALIRQTLYAEASPARQMRRHRAIAEALAELHGADAAGEHAGEIAHHYFRSRELPGAERGVEYALRGAERAAGAGAYDEVVRILGTALEILPDGDPRRARLLARLSLAQAWTLDFAAAVETAGRAGALLATTEGNDAAADYLAEAALNIILAGFKRGACALAARGRPYAGARRDTSWLVLAAIDIAGRQAEEPDTVGLLVETPECREVRELADQRDLTLEQRGVLATIGFSSYAAPGAQVKDAELLLALHASPFPQCRAFWENRAAFMAQRDQIDQEALCWAHVLRLRQAEGDLDGARAAHRRALALQARLPKPGYFAEILEVAAVERAMLTGECDEALLAKLEALLLQPTSELVYGQLAPLRAAVARLNAWLGRRERALHLIEAVVPALEQGSPYAYSYCYLACDTAEALWLLERTDHIQTVERCLRDKALPMRYAMPLRHTMLAAARLRALRGDVEGAAAQFDNARAALEWQGAHPLRAVAQFDEARLWERSGNASGAERAAHLRDNALRQFERLGMTGWIERARAHGTPSRDRTTAVSTTDGSSAASPRGAGPHDVDAPRFRADDGHFLLSFAGLTVRVRASLGVRYLAHLAARAGEAIPSRDLLAAVRAERPAGATTAEADEQGSGEMPDESKARFVLDADARAAYRQRLTDLREELAEAEEYADLLRAQRAREQIEALSDELAAALRLSDTPAQSSSETERTRLAVTKRVRAAIRLIGDAHPLLGRHLGERVQTGTFCTYWSASPRADAAGAGLAGHRADSRARVAES